MNYFLPFNFRPQRSSGERGLESVLELSQQGITVLVYDFDMTSILPELSLRKGSVFQVAVRMMKKYLFASRNGVWYVFV